MRRLIIVLIGFLGLFSCGKPKEKIPEGILTKEEIVPILADLHVAEKMIAKERLPFDSSRIVYHSYYKNKVLEDRGVSLALFDSSFVYYTDHIELMLEVYTDVVDTLGNRLSKKKMEKK